MKQIGVKMCLIHFLMCSYFLGFDSARAVNLIEQDSPHQWSLEIKKRTTPRGGNLRWTTELISGTKLNATIKSGLNYPKMDLKCSLELDKNPTLARDKKNPAEPEPTDTKNNPEVLRLTCIEKKQSMVKEVSCSPKPQEVSQGGGFVFKTNDEIDLSLMLNCKLSDKRNQ